MPLDPLGYVELAREMADRGDEHGYRTAINRAYYALFLTAKSLRDPSLWKKSGEGTHAQVIEWLERWGAKPGEGSSSAKQVKRTLRDLRTARRHADYELDAPVTAPMAEMALAQIEEIRHDLNRLQVIQAA